MSESADQQRLVDAIGREFDQRLKTRNGEIITLVRQELQPIVKRVEEVEDQIDGREGIESRLCVVEQRSTDRWTTFRYVAVSLIGAAAGLLTQRFLH